MTVAVLKNEAGQNAGLPPIVRKRLAAPHEGSRLGKRRSKVIRAKY
jgi:hypothetical protein